MDEQQTSQDIVQKIEALLDYVQDDGEWEGFKEFLIEGDYLNENELEIMQSNNDDAIQRVILGKALVYKPPHAWAIAACVRDALFPHQHDKRPHESNKMTSTAEAMANAALPDTPSQKILGESPSFVRRMLAEVDVNISRGNLVEIFNFLMDNEDTD